MARHESETTCRFAPQGSGRGDDEGEAGQALTEYVALAALVVLVIAIVLVTARPIGTDVGDQLACAVEQVGTPDAPEECVSGDELGDDEQGDDEVDPPVVQPDGLGGPSTGLRCRPEYDFCQPEELEEGQIPVCIVPLGTLGCGVQEIDEDDLPPYDPDDDCTTDDSCEDVWEGSLEPHESEGDIREVGFLPCNFNLLGWYPNGWARFSWEVRSLTGSGGATPSVCVGGSGTVNIDREGVERFDSGENSGWFIYKGADGDEYKHYFEEGDTTYFDPSSTIYEVHID